MKLATTRFSFPTREIPLIKNVRLYVFKENEFEKELPSPLPERLAPLLLKNKAVQGVFAKYDLTDDFGASPEYEKLYTELTGIIVLLIEDNHLPTIDSESDIV